MKIDNKKINNELSYIRVKVSAGAKKEIIKQISVDHFEISVKEKAERNMANRRVLEMLCDFFKLSKGKIRIVNGHQSQSKLLVLEK